jgi:hypothetical protein
MRRTTATLLLLLVLEPAFAGERGPVCREPDLRLFWPTEAITAP